MRWLPWFLVPLTSALVGGLMGTTIPLWLRTEVFHIDPLPATSPAPDEAVPEVRVGRLAPPPPDQPSLSPLAPPPCIQGWRLIGAAVVRERHSRSVIALRSPNGAAVLGVDESFSDRTVVEIEARQVTLRDSNGMLCRLGFDENAASEVREVRVDGPRVVDRVLFERALTPDGAHELLGSTRLVASPRGIRVFGMRSGTPVAELGIENGDVLLEADGEPITVDSGLTLYGRIQRGESVNLAIERHGERIERSFRLGND